MSPPEAYAVLNEASFIFDEMGDSKNPHGKSKRRALLAAYSKSERDSRLDGTTHSKEENDVPFALSPSLTIVAEGQPDRFYEAVSENDAQDGVLNRFEIVDCSRNHRGQFNASRASGIDPAVVERLRPLAAISASETFEPQVLPDFCEVGWTPEAWARHRQYLNDVTDRLSPQRDKLKYDLFGRSHARIMQYAALQAIADNPIEPRIGLAHYDWAADFIWRERTALYQKFRADEIGGGDRRRYSDAIKVLRNFASTRDRKIGKRERELGIVPNWWLRQHVQRQRSFQSVPDRLAATFDVTLKALMQDGYLVQPNADARVDLAIATF